MRFFARLILLAVVIGGLYYWHRRTGPVRDLGEVGRHLRDTEITGEVKAALGLNHVLRPYPIEVATEDGIVSLRGEVASEDVRATAERVAAAVPDARQVVNHLRVSPGAAPPAGRERTLGESLDDHALELRLRVAFSLHRELKGSDISVSAYRREVTLTGKAKSDVQRRLALSVAQETDGVEGVKDELRLRGEVAAGGRIASVEKALAASASLKPYPLKVREEGGKLVLKGRVRTSAEKDLAGLIAKEAAGSPVENAIEVNR